MVITGPSGVGKGTLIAALRERLPELELAVSVTTRPPRAGERDGLDYHFVDDAEFDRRLAADDFVEHAVYAGRRYGTPHAELAGRAAGSIPVVLEIEVQGARQVRDRLPEALLVFVAPPSVPALRERLAARGTDDAQQVGDRLRTAVAELDARDEFDCVVVNDRLNDAVDQLERVVRSAIGGDRASTTLPDPPDRG